MHSSPPLEPHPVKSYYYITDAQADWPAERQDAWLQKFNYATLADITAHEVAPGHYVHSLFMRRTPGKIRRIWIGLNPFPQPSSGQDGWAHYAEQLVADEGFKRDDPRYRLAQLSEALTRICRLISGIRLHSGEWTVDRAAQLFEAEAHLPAPAARQEADARHLRSDLRRLLPRQDGGAQAAPRRRGGAGRARSICASSTSA